MIMRGYKWASLVTLWKASVSSQGRDQLFSPGLLVDHSHWILKSKQKFQLVTLESK